MFLIELLDVVFELYWWILVARFVVTWVPNLNLGHPVVRFLFTITDPVVRPFRGIIPPYGNVDFSPAVLFLVLRLVYPLFRKLLVQLLFLR